MGNKAEKLVDNHKEVETTNVGLLNISETSENLMGVGEKIVLALLVLLTIKWCCKRYHRARMAQQQELEMIIRRNTAGTSPTAPPQQQRPQEMMPVVTFQQPGERRVAMAMPGASHWETCK